jgi:peptide deformylase
LTPAYQQLKSPAMAIREIIILPDKQLRWFQTIEKSRRSSQAADDMFDHVRRA